jgi:hypothetical protein
LFDEKRIHTAPLRKSEAGLCCFCRIALLPGALCLSRPGGGRVAELFFRKKGRAGGFLSIHRQEREKMNAQFPTKRVYKKGKICYI